MERRHGRVVSMVRLTDNQGRDDSSSPAGPVDAVAIADWPLLELDFEKITFTASNDSTPSLASCARVSSAARTEPRLVALAEAMRRSATAAPFRR